MRIVCLSDTHGLHDRIKVPDGDLLIHAGDFCNTGSEQDVQKFAKWFCDLPHPHKVVVAGNHDWFFQKQPDLARLYFEGDATYLQDSGCEIQGLKIWGSPWQPWFMDWAFNLPRGERLAEKWAQIPDDTQVLITHSPPSGLLDKLPGPHGEYVGCEALLARIKGLPSLRLHVFGHIHSGYGVSAHNGVQFVNACVCTEEYRPLNLIIVLEARLDGGFSRIE